MNAPPYQKLFWGSYHKHTAHLGHAREHGAYLLLIGALWNNEGKLPADDDTLAGYAKLTVKEWLAVKPKLMPLFRISRGKIMQPRVTEDLAKYRDTSGKRKEAGKTGGKASGEKRRGNRQANASVLPTKPEPETEPKKEPPVVPPRGTSSPKVTKDQVEAIWSACPSKARERSSRADVEIALNSALRRGHQPEAVLAGLLAAYRTDTYAGDRAKGIHRLIDRDRWQSHVEAASASASGPPVCTFEGPPELRSAVVKLKDEAFALSWIDPCEWLPDERTLIARNSFAAETLRRELGDWLKRARVTVSAPDARPAAPLFRVGSDDRPAL